MKAYLLENQDLGICAPQILGFDVAWSHFGVAWHKNGVID